MKFKIAGVVLGLAVMSCNVWAQTTEPKEETHQNTARSQAVWKSKEVVIIG